MEKSPAVRVDEETYGGFTNDVTAPIVGAIVKVKPSPGWSVGGVAAVEETQRTTLAGCPTENSAGVMPKATLLLCCARTPGAGMNIDDIASESRNGKNARFLRITLFAIAPPYCSIESYGRSLPAIIFTRSARFSLSTYPHAPASCASSRRFWS